MRFVWFSRYTRATSLLDNRLGCITDTDYYCLLERTFNFVCNLYLLHHSDVNNQQDATTFSFINLFNSALHVSGNKFADTLEHFLTLYTALGTMHRHCCQPVARLRWNGVPSQTWYRPAAVSVHCTNSCIYSQKVLLRMGEFVARNM